MTRRNTEADVWKKVDKNGPGGCWLWTGSCTWDGYGVAYYRPFSGEHSHSGATRASRTIWRFVNGEIPEGMELDHLCRVRHCVNPAHLEVCDHRTNTLRGFGPPGINARQTGCLKFGHPLDRLDANGHRRCSTCDRIRDRARYAAGLKPTRRQKALRALSHRGTS